LPEFNRRRRLRALNLGDKRVLAAALDDLGPLGEIELLKGPEPGLVMVRGRIGGSGPPFNLGELLVTRCALRTGGRVGHSMVGGYDPEGAILAALADALAQDPALTARIDEAAAELERALKAKDAREMAETMATKVEFLTMVRGGEDD
jgi:alpha-D-ribose 1-methylphosphonate 5-triphosphate synthase subunit PhnG